MTQVLIIGETTGDAVARGTLELISLARSLASAAEITILPLYGSDTALEKMASYASVVRPQSIPLDYNPVLAAASVRNAVRQLSPDLVLMSYSLAGVELGPVSAAACDGCCISGVQHADIASGSINCDVLLYDGKLVGKATGSLPASLIILVGAYPPAEPLDSRAAISVLSDTDQFTIVPMLATPVPPDLEVFDLASARGIVSVGRGIGSQEKLGAFRELASLLGAEIAGSRPVIDNGWLSKDRQVGKSGQSVRPELYLSMGISGAVEHLEGIVGAEYVVAVNTDEKAPIFRRADLGITCDIFDFADAFGEALRKRNG